MNDDLFPFLLIGSTPTNTGPTTKELLLDKAENEYNNDNQLHSIFYQVRTLFHVFEERFQKINTAGESDFEKGENKTYIAMADNLINQMTEWENDDSRRNPLMQYALKTIALPLPSTASNCKSVYESHFESDNFLHNILDPLHGINKIEEICQQMPKEWTILQLCKGPRPETTYSIFPQIHERDAAIYLTLLRHVRSTKYPKPLCLRFCGPEQSELFRKYANIANRFKECINVDPKTTSSREAKQLYWEILGDLNNFIRIALADLKNFFFPWSFLFTGKPYNDKMDFSNVDSFCDEFHWKPNERVLLSLAALHITTLSAREIQDICKSIATNEQQQALAMKLLLQFQLDTQDSAIKSTEPLKHYPCILIVDERLDHFFWEEMNVEQEFCRFNTLQCLWRLFQFYKPCIEQGYLKVDINDGGCLVNPDNNLPKTHLRMQRFFEYWTPHWLMKFAEKPTQDVLLKEYFKRPCYVYAGHGSGLQYVNGKHIANQNMNCVVFLFGCDSSRLHSSGLYSELIGPHFYYHAAMCPTLVGTLMPALDANMDTVAVEILSRWIAPKSSHILPWDGIDHNFWLKNGTIKPAKTSSSGDTPSIANVSNYHTGSLCAILARIHQRNVEPKFYNTVPYVCRGLPVWNCNVEPLPQ